MIDACHDTLRCAAAIVARADHSDTAAELVASVRASLSERSADLCLLAASAHVEDEIDRIASEVFERLRPGALIGATAEAVINGACEYESQSAVTLWAAHLPRAGVRSFHLSQEDLERLEDPAEFAEHLGVDPADDPSFVLIGDPFSVSPYDLLQRLEGAYPQRPAVGGMASAAEKPRQNVMIFDGQTLRHGVCGAALWGDVRVDAVVSQGCRPIGRPYVVTRAERNVILSLGGRTPLAVVRELFETASDRDRELAERRLLIGRAVRESRGAPRRGDFLIRNPLRLSTDSGAMEVDDLFRVGQTVQFHVRDSQSADEELAALLQTAPKGAAGALLFSCNGRGTHLFPQRSHDARAVAGACGQLPLAGLFCAGEIGPIGARNFLYGHTASIGFFRPAG